MKTFQFILNWFPLRERLNVATVATFNTQNVATVATFNTQNVATLEIEKHIIQIKLKLCVVNNPPVPSNIKETIQSDFLFVFVLIC